MMIVLNVIHVGYGILNMWALVLVLEVGFFKDTVFFRVIHVHINAHTHTHTHTHIH